MPGQAHIQLAVPKDLDFVDHFRCVHAYRDIGWCPRGALAARIESKRIMVARVNDQLVGFVNFTARKDGRCHISQAAILEDAWRNGWGEQLVTACLHTAAARGSVTATLKCARGAFANHFWSSIGFTHLADVAGRRRVLHAYAMPLRPGGALRMPPDSPWSAGGARTLMEVHDADDHRPDYATVG